MGFTAGLGVEVFLFLGAQDGNGAAHFLCARVSDAVQRKSGAFERHGDGRTGEWFAWREGRATAGASTAESIQHRFRTAVRFEIQRAGGIFLEVHGRAYDFNTILNTPLNFPIQFRKSKIDGALVRATLNNLHGLSAFSVLGHSRSRLFSPETGGINFGTAYAPVARPDHDQGFEQTTDLQYQFAQKAMHGFWLGLT